LSVSPFVIFLAAYAPHSISYILKALRLNVVHAVNTNSDTVNDYGLFGRPVTGSFQRTVALLLL